MRLRAKNGWLTLATALAVTLAALSTISAFRECYPYQNSDTLYPILLARDVDAGGSLRSWTITPAPSYVDNFVVWVLTHVTSNLRDVFAYYAVLVFFVMLGGAALVHRGAGWSRRHALIFASLGVAVFFGAVHEPSTARGTFFFPTVHGMPVYVLLFACGVIARAANKKRLRTAIVGGLVLGAFASGDSLFVPQVLAPLAVLTLAARFRRAFERPLRRAITAFSIACVSGLLGTTALLRAIGPRVPGREFKVTWPLTLAGIHQFGDYLRREFFYEVNGIGVVLWFAWVAVLVVFLVRRVAERRPFDTRAFVPAFGFLSVVTSIGAAIVLGTWADAPIERYALPTFVAPFLFLAVGSRVAGFALGGGALLALLRFGPPWPLPPPSESFVRPMPESLDERVRELVRTGVTVGMARYWDAKQLMVHTPGARISHFDGGRTGYWITNGDWLFEMLPTGKMVLPERFFTVEEDGIDDPIQYEWGRLETTEIFPNYKLQVFHVKPTGYVRAVREICNQMSIDQGALCAPWRARTSLLPLLAAADDQPSFVTHYDLTPARSIGDVMKVPPGRYRLRVWFAGRAPEITLVEPVDRSSLVTATKAGDGFVDVFAKAGPNGIALELHAREPVHLVDVRLYAD